MKHITEEKLLQRQNNEVLEWAEAHNHVTQNAFTQNEFYEQVKKDTLDILQAQDKIPFISFRGPYVYNLWNDEHHNRGLIRRTTLEEYFKDEPKWEDVLDIDKLAADEDKPWVYKGTSWLQPDFKRSLVHLSNGGGDTTEIREFDPETKTFIKDGFYIPPAKSDVVWIDKNHLLVGTEIGEDSLTKSGYPRTVRLLTRGQSLEEAPVIFEGQPEDVSVDAWSSVRPEGTIYCLQRSLDFYNAEYFIWNPEHPSEVTQVNIPTHVAIEDVFNGEFILRPREDWAVGEKVYKAGSILSMDPLDISTLQAIYVPKERTKVDGVNSLATKLVLKITDETLNSQIFEAVKMPKEWWMVRLPMPQVGTMDLVTAADNRDDYMLTHEGPLNPVKLYYLDPENIQPVVIKQMPDRFNADNMQVEQFHAVSKDGTAIPYTVLRPKDIKLDGSTPTILYGYGGFEISLDPHYSASIGKNWVEHGGCFVMSNIRGGGEFGPEWHQAALKENRQVAYDDFIAIAEDLIARGISSPQHLGIKGGSNGGLLVGAVFVQRPELFAAVDCAVPLLRMMDYHKLSEGAGNSWVGEFGDPDDESHPEIREAILKYSPYDNVQANKKYPQVFFNTSMHDDRVHPGHARTMVNKMENQGHKVYYFETLKEGGHGYANLEQTAEQVGLSYSYFAKMLGLDLKLEHDQQLGKTQTWTPMQVDNKSDVYSMDLESLVQESEANHTEEPMDLESPAKRRRI